MKISASQLRSNIYKILDQIIKNGQPVEIERKGTILRIIVPKSSFAKLNKLKKRKLTDEDSENFTHIDWTHEWSEK